jgi:hypothetical protein
MKKPAVVLFGRYLPMAETQSMCIVCLHVRRKFSDTFIELIEKRKSKLCRVCISLAPRNSRSELRQVEKGPSTQPIDATSFIDG